MVPGEAHGGEQQGGDEDDPAEAGVEHGHLGVGPNGLHPGGPRSCGATTERFDAGGDGQQHGGVPGEEGCFGVHDQRDPTSSAAEGPSAGVTSVNSSRSSSASAS